MPWHVFKSFSIITYVSGHLAFILFTHSFNKYLLSVSNMSGSVLGGFCVLDELKV